MYDGDEKLKEATKQTAGYIQVGSKLKRGGGCKPIKNVSAPVFNACIRSIFAPPPKKKIGMGVLSATPLFSRSQFAV